MFASETTDTVTIGQVVVTIQKLNWKALRKAAQAQYERFVKQAAALASTASQSSEELQKALAAREETKRQEAAVDVPVDAAKLKEERYGLYDQDTVLTFGVKSWTANRDLRTGLDDLEDVPATKLHRAILDLSLPSIDEQAREHERKND